MNEEGALRLMRYPEHILKLVSVLRRLPGVGTKSAERYAFHLTGWSDERLRELGNAISETKEKLRQCNECGCLVDGALCHLCQSNERDFSTLCIVATCRDVFAMEETRQYKGLYHVLDGLLSPLDGRGPEHLSLHKLTRRLEKLPIKEVVVALDSTLEGDATALFLKQELAPFPIKVSRLAFGLPMGSSLDYVDGGTLARALAGRGHY